MNAAATRISVIVPTFREAPNIEPLTRRVFAATDHAGLDAELIFVDDNSRDGSFEKVQALAADRPVRMIVRTAERGLSSAVLAGFAAARHGIFVVLDADLQHPPEMIPALVAPVAEGRADVAVGSRYVAGGALEEDWPLRRRWTSAAATLLARPLTTVRDPMSGFFCLRRDVWTTAAMLNPVGYKIALELIVKSRGARTVEVPITFADRAAGRSKLSFAEQARYLRHLFRLYAFKLRG